MATGYLVAAIGTTLQYFTDQGVVLSGGTVSTFVAGTTTPVATFTDSTLGVSNGTVITLNSNGRLPASCWVGTGVTVKMVLKDAQGNLIPNGTIDNLSGINDYSIGTVTDASLAPSSVIYAIDQTYFRTPAEIAAGVTPTNFGWATLNPLRYGAVGDGATNDATAVQAAFTVAGKAGGEVLFPPGYIFLCSSDITVPCASTFAGPCASMRGQGWSNPSIIFGTGSTFGFVYLGGGATTGGTTSSNYYYAGTVINLGVKMQGTSNTAFYCNSVNQPQMSKVWVAGTTGQGRAFYFLNCLLPVFEDCLVTGMGSATQGSVEFDSCTTATWRGSRISGGVTTTGGLLIDRCTNFVANGLSVESVGTLIKIGSKAEASLACTGVTLDGLELENPGAGNPYIDIGQGLSGSALVLNVTIRGLFGSPSGTTTVPYAVRIKSTSGFIAEASHFTLGAAPTSCFELPDTSCSGVVIRAHRNLQSLATPWVRYNAVQVQSAGPQYDWWLGKTKNSAPICQVDGLKDWFNTALTGATPDIRISTTMGGYYSAVNMTNGGATTVTSLSNGELGMHLYILATDSNTTLTFGNSGGAFRMKSGANVTMSAGKIYEFVNDGASGAASGSCWVQIGDN